MIADVGAGRTSHRAIAARAGVPLGATTYYFPSLRELITAALHQATEEATRQLRDWAAELADVTDLPAAITDLAQRYASDRARAILEYELYLAAARDPDLRPVARARIDGARDLLAQRTSPAVAAAVVTLIDGAVLQAIVTDSDVDTPTLRNTIAHLLDG